MLARWEKAGAGDEPDWKVDALEPLSLPQRSDEGAPTGGR